MSSTKINKKTNKHEEVERELPDFKSPAPKNKRETQDWNRMSERMEGFHSYFRTTFQTIWEVSSLLLSFLLGSLLHRIIFILLI